MNRLFCIPVLAGLLLGGTLALPPQNANAAAASAPTAETLSEIEPCFLTRISVKVKYYPATGYVNAIAKNEFTFLPSTVPVKIKLYASEINHFDYNDMDLVAQNSTPDLNMGSEIKCNVPHDREMYYIAAVTYKDNGTLHTIQSVTMHFDAGGAELP